MGANSIFFSSRWRKSCRVSHRTFQKVLGWSILRNLPYCESVLLSPRLRWRCSVFLLVVLWTFLFETCLLCSLNVFPAINGRGLRKSDYRKCDIHTCPLEFPPCEFCKRDDAPERSFHVSKILAFRNHEESSFRSKASTPQFSELSPKNEQYHFPSKRLTTRRFAPYLRGVQSRRIHCRISARGQAVNPASFLTSTVY